MTVIGAVQPSDFSEPSPQEVAGLIDQIRAEEVPAVFGSEVFPSAVLEQIAERSRRRLRRPAARRRPARRAGRARAHLPRHDAPNMELMLPALGGNVDALAGIAPWDTYLP